MPPLIDTHAHCFAGPDDPRFPYCADAPYRPARIATAEQLLACMEAERVDACLLVQAEPYGHDHRLLEHSLAVGGGRLRGTALVFADRPGAIDTLRGLARRAPIAAVRIHAYAPERLPPFGRPSLAALFGAAADLGLAVQLHFEPRHAPAFEPLLAAFPTVTVVIDHLGRPMQGSPEEHSRVLAWGARFPSAVVKLSELPSPDSYPFRDPAPVVRALLEAFGPARTMWGGEFGTYNEPKGYARQLARVRGFIAHLSAADQALVLGENARRLLGFG